MTFRSAIFGTSFVTLLATMTFPAWSMMEGLDGQWVGKGSAYVNNLGNVRAGCRFGVDGNGSQLMMDGSCGIGPLRGGLGLKLNISATGSVSGTYTGSRSGPATLSGRIDGDVLRMQIEWAGVVNGDRAAEMILQRTGENSFSQVVFDIVGGETRRTSDFDFVRR